MPTRTPQGQWVLWHRATGQQLTRWPVDAGGMVASGEYSFTPPDGVTPVLPAPPPAAAQPLAPLPPGATRAEDASPGAPMAIRRSTGKKAS